VAGVTVVMKLGGSVVTEKDRRETVDEAALEAAAAALAGASEPLVVVHGGGSFGHPNAADHGVTEARGTHDSAAIEAIHGAMVRLNSRVVAVLREAGLAAVPVQPLSVASRDAGGELDMPGEALGRSVREGFVPVLHGDLITHEGEGVTVLSGDELVPAVVLAVDADRVGVCTTVRGVLDESGEVVDAITSRVEVPDAVGDSDATDVTDGMAGKVAQLLDLEVPAQVFGPEAIETFLAGGRPGTTVLGS
jgi:isopentenyl phosphate kinase